MLGAGLLAADPLRWLPPAWLDATLPPGVRVAALIVLLSVALWRIGGRSRRGREVQVLVLPSRISRGPEA